MTIRSWAGAKQVIFFFVLSVYAHGQITTDTVRYVIDGDTVQFKTMNCRFAYVDTPESGDNPKALKDSRRYNIPLQEIYQAGRLAKRYTKSFIRKGASYSIDVKKRGRYGRNICEIFLEDGKSFNKKIVKDGFAVPFWRYIPLTKKGEYYGAVKQAQRGHKGLWRISPYLMRRMLGE